LERAFPAESFTTKEIILFAVPDEDTDAESTVAVIVAGLPKNVMVFAA